MEVRLPYKYFTTANMIINYSEVRSFWKYKTNHEQNSRLGFTLIWAQSLKRPENSIISAQYRNGPSETHTDSWYDHKLCRGREALEKKQAKSSTEKYQLRMRKKGKKTCNILLAFISFQQKWRHYPSSPHVFPKIEITLCSAEVWKQTRHHWSMPYVGGVFSSDTLGFCFVMLIKLVLVFVRCGTKVIHCRRLHRILKGCQVL